MERYTFEITNDGRRIEPLQNDLQDVLDASGVRLKSIYTINLALGEWLENVIQHAFADGAEHRIVIECILADDALVLRVRDNGRPFDPTEFPASSAKGEDVFAPRGIELMRKLVDALSYRRDNDWNVVELRKQISRKED